jgi:TonB family protein
MKIFFLMPIAFAGAAFAADEPKLFTEAEMKARAAQPVVIVAPTYPAAAARDRVEGTVDVHGLVLSDGNFDLKRVEGERDDLKAAVKDVIELWRFVPGYGEDCSPRPVEAQLRVWFEMKDGKPSISISRPVKTPEPPRLDEAAGTLKAVKRSDPAYPPAAIRANKQGKVEALLLVGEEGDVKRVEIVPSTTHQIFSNEVAKALSKWKFEPRPGGKSVCAIYTVVFSLRD